MFKILLLLFSTQLLANPNSICGQKDEREPSFVREIGRAIKFNSPIGCTITMIGRSCAISAGHCYQDLETVQFNMYLNKNGVLISSPEDTYSIDRDSIISENSGHGKDWSVFRIKKNLLTKSYPGEVQGFLAVARGSSLNVGDPVTIIGYGWKSKNEVKLAPQQSHTSFLMAREKGILYYDVDTMGGNSGSSILDESGNIIGVHTHGYCSEDGGANQGTAIFGKFKAAIRNCLGTEKLVLDP